MRFRLIQHNSNPTEIPITSKVNSLIQEAPLPSRNSLLPTLSYICSTTTKHKLRTYIKMKKLLIIAAFALPLAWTACSGDKPEVQEEVIPPGMRAVDLTLDSLGFPLKINAPDSTNGELMAEVTPNGIQVRVGSKYDLLVNAGGPEETDLAAQKALIEATDIGTSTFSVNDATTLVWETKFGEGDGALSVYHFYTVVKVGGDTYYVRDNNTNPDNQFTKANVDAMLEAAKSLRASKPAATEPEA
jgi:hypothetical protein